MLPNIRQVALAFFAGGCLASVVDLVLAGLLNAVRVSGDVPLSSLLPERIAARGLWLTGPPLVWMTARPIASRLESIFADGAPSAPFSRVLIWKVVGLLMMITPPLLVVAGWGTLVLRITLARSWTFEGAVFLTLAFYSTPVLAIAPTVLAGAALHALGRHLNAG